MFTDPFHPGCKWVKNPGWRCNTTPTAPPCAAQRSHCLVLDWRSQPMIDQQRAANSSQWKCSVIRLQLRLHHEHFKLFQKSIFSHLNILWFLWLICDASSGTIKEKKMRLKFEGCRCIFCESRISKGWSGSSVSLLVWSFISFGSSCRKKRRLTDADFERLLNKPSCWWSCGGTSVTQLTLLRSGCWYRWYI